MGTCGYAFSSRRGGGGYFSCFPPSPLLLCREGFCYPVLQCLGAILARLSRYGKGTVCRAPCYPRVRSFLRASDEGDERRGHRGHREHYSQHSSAMTSDPDSPPSPHRAGQPEAGGAPLALAFPFACVGGSLLRVLGSGCAQWTPASRQACKSEAMQCLSLPQLRLSKELVFYPPAQHPAVLMHPYTQKSPLD